jgi:membrane protease YdiL (CAAX protease family)
MESIKAVFWNSDQRRLRTLWRLIGQFFLLIAIALPLEAATSFVAFGLLMAQEGITPGSLDPQTVQQLLLQSPLVMTLSTVALLGSFTLSVWLAGRFLDRRRFADFGFHVDGCWWMDFGFGLLLGAILMLTIFLIELTVGWVTVSGTFVTTDVGASFAPAILVPLVTFLAVGFYEELFFRGYQLQNLAEGLTWTVIGPRVAIVIATLVSAAVFGVFHALNPNASVVSTLNIAFAGVFLAMGYLLTGELAISIGLHIAWNFFQGNVFGFPVSGTAVRSATFIGVEQSGPGVWTGGAFGPEAGLLGLGAMVVGILLTILWVQWRYGEVRLDLSLAEAPTLSGPTLSGLTKGAEHAEREA